MGAIKTMEDQEYILCAAIHYDDVKVYIHQPTNIKTGFVIAGRRHHNCVYTFGILNKELVMKLKATHTDGFITNTNRFVDRKEAFKIAKDANQIISIANTRSKNLYSEDLY